MEWSGLSFSMTPISTGCLQHTYILNASGELNCSNSIDTKPQNLYRKLNSYKKNQIILLVYKQTRSHEYTLRMCAVHSTCVYWLYTPQCYAPDPFINTSPISTVPCKYTNYEPDLATAQNHSCTWFRW